MTDHIHSGCGHHHHGPVLSTATRLAEADALCLRQGMRLTEQRRVILEALLNASKALGAYDLIEVLAARTGKRVAPITIYRVLDFLVETGLVHRIESRNAFLACPGNQGAHALAVFMICDCCGRVDEALSPALEAQLGRLAAEQGFSPKGRIIEMAGLCSACGEVAMDAPGKAAKEIARKPA